MTRSPTVAACHQPTDPSRPLNRGSLRILPSLVPGLTAFNARWFTSSETVDLAVSTTLVFAARLQSTSAINLDSVALVYRGEHASTPLYIGDASWPAIYTATESSWDRPLAPVVEPHGTRSIETIWQAFTGFSTSTSWVHNCPALLPLAAQRFSVHT